jgi:DNA-binding beta-propeller fold protein YncE
MVSIKFQRLLPILLAACLMYPAFSPAAEPGRPAVELASPVRIAEGEGVLFISDHRRKAVFVVNKRTLKTLRSFPIDGAPVAVASHRGRIYVGNESRGRVEAYNPAGKHLFDFGGPDSGAMRPSDMAIDEGSGRLFVADSSARAVKIFDLDGSLLQTIASPALVNPTGIALDAESREIAVSDYGDPALKYPARVLVFDHAGNLLRTLWGRSAGFSRPQGMAAAGGRLYLADALAGKVLVLDRVTGAVVRTLGSFGSQPGQLMLPLDVSLDPVTGDVYVTNNRPGRIERFPEGGLLP